MIGIMIMQSYTSYHIDILIHIIIVVQTKK